MATNTMRTSIHTTTPATSPAVKVTAAGASEKKKTLYRKWNKTIKDSRLLINDKSIFLLGFHASESAILEESQLYETISIIPFIH